MRATIDNLTFEAELDGIVHGMLMFRLVHVGPYGRRYYGDYLMTLFGDDGTRIRVPVELELPGTDDKFGTLTVMQPIHMTFDKGCCK